MKKFTYSDVNKAMKNVLSYMYHIEKVWNKSRNLKLYEAFFKADELLDKYPLLKAECDAYDCFHNFCGVSYDDFKNDLEMGFIKDLRVYIGNTSTFYITHLHECINRGELLQELFETVGVGTCLDFNENGEVQPFTWSDYHTESELIEVYQDDMEYFVTRFIYDVKEYMQDAIDLANYIDEFKENQVDNFDEYLDNENEFTAQRLEEEAEQELENKILLGCKVIANAM